MGKVWYHIKESQLQGDILLDQSVMGRVSNICDIENCECNTPNSEAENQ